LNVFGAKTTPQGGNIARDFTLLNGELFFSLAEVQAVIEDWRRHFNAVRPHSSLAYRPPAPEAIVPRSGAFLPWASAPATSISARPPNQTMASIMPLN